MLHGVVIVLYLVEVCDIGDSIDIITTIKNKCLHL